MMMMMKMIQLLKVLLFIFWNFEFLLEVENLLLLFAKLPHLSTRSLINHSQTHTNLTCLSSVTYERPRVFVQQTQ